MHKIKKLPLIHQIVNCQKSTNWDLGNSVLYNLCENNFDHSSDEKIIAKVWLIGRVYAAAIERRRINDYQINDEFYSKSVVSAFQKSRIDPLLKLLKTSKITFETIPSILIAHYTICNEIYEITKLRKRSFSSKYLHFHLPRLFFIYDTRAVNAIRDIVGELPKSFPVDILNEAQDKEYALFYLKCFLLQTFINNEFNILLTPRQIDNLLVEHANSKLKSKKSAATNSAQSQNQAFT